MRHERERASIVRIALSLALLLIILAFLVFVMPWYFPYDRLEHLYAVEGIETIEQGHPGGEFVLLCSSINDDGELELMVNGKVYTKAERVDQEHYRVWLGPELFEQPCRLELALRESYQIPVKLRSNTIHLYVTPKEAQ